MSLEIEEFIFPSDPAATGYCVFPSALEEDPLVVFHATPVENLQAIVDHGFKIPDPTGAKGLSSVSFAKRSAAALHHGITKRAERPGAFCIVAVRYDTFQRHLLVENLTDIHDYTLDPRPEIIGYLIVPASYQHI